MNLHNYFNGKYTDPTHRSASTTRARIKAWDHRHEFSPVEEEENYLPAYRTPDPEQIEALNLWADLQDWEPLLHREYTCDYETGEYISTVTLEDKLEFIVNPALTMGEVWELTCSEVPEPRDVMMSEQYDRAYEEYWYGDMYYEDYYEMRNRGCEEELFPNEYYEINGHTVRRKDGYYRYVESPRYVFSDYELEKAGNKWCEDVAVWRTTHVEIARFEESCEPPTPDPAPSILHHHYRKAA